MNNATINFYGYYNVEILTLEIDYQNKVLKASNGRNDSVHPYFSDNIYFKVEIYRNDLILHREVVYGRDSSVGVVERLNNFILEEGDYIKLYHGEPEVRAKIFGSVIDGPHDLSVGLGGIDFENSYFYPTDRGLLYSNEVINKRDYLNKMVDQIEKNKDNYEYVGYDKAKIIIDEAMVALKNPNTTEDIIREKIVQLRNAMDGLKEKSKIIFKGANGEKCLELSMDGRNNRYVAVGVGTAINPDAPKLQYAEIAIYNKRGIKRLSYVLRGEDNTLELASILSNMVYEDEDYLKMSHVASGDKLLIGGYVENAPFDLGTGFKDLDLTSCFFYIKRETIIYSNTMKEISTDKTSLNTMIKSLKESNYNKVLKATYNNLEKALLKGENLLKTPFVTNQEISYEIQEINKARECLKWETRIEFRGILYKGGAHEFLALEINPIRQVLKTEILHNDSVHTYFKGRKYLEITLYDKNGNIKITGSLEGQDASRKLHEMFNNYKYEKDDYLKFYAAEPNKVRIKGYVEGAPYDLSTDEGCRRLNLDTGRFYFTYDSLGYKNVEATRGALEKTIGELLKNRALRENIEFQKNIIGAQNLLNRKEVNIEDVEKINFKLKKLYID